MPRKAALVANITLHTTLPAELMAKLQLSLWSDLEGRVPAGAIQAVLIRLLRQHFEAKTLDLAPFLNSQTNIHVVSGPEHTVSALKTLLLNQPNGTSSENGVSK